ncbi:MAG: hypothetical protein H6Q00_2746 [Holophagaceae bacterium]|nr:hypothetical protein [Holophagaceae bacterium]
MSRIQLPLFLVLGASLAAQAQEPRIGLGLNLSFPTAAFARSEYAPVLQGDPNQVETYDLGVGAQLTASFPLDQHVAFRAVMAYQSTSGNYTDGYDRINLQHNVFSLGGEIHIFPESAYRQRGPYLFGGLSADFERFDRSYGEVNVDYTESYNKSRLGGTVGIGNSFPMGSSRWILEAAYHTSLTSTDVSAGNPPATSFVRVTVGWVF